MEQVAHTHTHTHTHTHITHSHQGLQLGVHGRHKCHCQGPQAGQARTTTKRMHLLVGKCICISVCVYLGVWKGVGVGEVQHLCTCVCVCVCVPVNCVLCIFCTFVQAWCTAGMCSAHI